MADQTALPSASSNSSSFLTCLHSRLIDEVLSDDGQGTGKVRCVECGAVFDDPNRRHN